MTTYYLYVKTHNKTRLNYLGFTIRDPYKYNGSGKYWLNHLKQYGTDLSTKIIFETSSYDELKQIGLFFSNIFDVVQSDNWANLKPEYGDSGFGWKHSPEILEKMRQRSLGRKHTPEAKEKCRIAKLGKKQSPEHIAKLSKVRKGKTPHNKGKQSPFIGVPRTEECKKNIKLGIMKLGKVEMTCPVCGKIGIGNSMKRWHFDNCKHKDIGTIQ